MRAARIRALSQAAPLGKRIAPIGSGWEVTAGFANLSNLLPRAFNPLNSVRDLSGSLDRAD